MKEWRKDSCCQAFASVSWSVGLSTNAPGGVDGNDNVLRPQLSAIKQTPEITVINLFSVFVKWKQQSTNDHNITLIHNLVYVLFFIFSLIRDLKANRTTPLAAGNLFFYLLLLMVEGGFNSTSKTQINDKILKWRSRLHHTLFFYLSQP